MFVKGYRMKQLDNIPKIDRKIILTSNKECKVRYNSAHDVVELEVGGTTLRVAVKSFFAIHEMMRKAAAKLVMQTQLNEMHAPAKAVSLPINDHCVPEDSYVPYAFF